MAEKDWVLPIRRLLTARRWTQGDLATAAGIRQNTLSEALTGRSPRMATMEAIARAFDVPLWTLFVDERQADLLTKHRVAEDTLTREAEITARVEKNVLARLAGIVADETAKEVGPKRIEAETAKPKKKHA